MGRLADHWAKASKTIFERYGDRIAQIIIAGASGRSAANLIRRGESPRILVDNSVLGHAISHRTAWISTGTKLWGGKIPIDTGYAARVPVYYPVEKEEARRSVMYLPGIAYLAEKKLLRLFTSGELEKEKLDQPAGRYSGYGYFDLNLFAKAHFEYIDDGSYSVIGGGSSTLKAQRQARLREKTDPFYLELLKRFGQSHSQDAWHITVAHRNRMDCFLTMDFSLLNIIENQKHLSPLRDMQTRVMTPHDLGNELSLRPIDLASISFLRSSWFVRPDLAMPARGRRRVSKHDRSGR